MASERKRKSEKPESHGDKGVLVTADPATSLSVYSPESTGTSSNTIRFNANVYEVETR
jgi:hypothetical protein